MFRNGQTIYCKTPQIAKKVRAYAKKLNDDTRLTAAEEAPNFADESPAIVQKIEQEHPGITEQVATTIDSGLFPKFLLDVMNGGAYPNMEDLTREEQRILYDPAINGLVNQYRAAKSFTLTLQIKARLNEIGVDL